jgi:outer membrane protein insertion porin family
VASYLGAPQRTSDTTFERIPVPITRRFYSGGSESIRGWKSRELGAVPVPNQGGNALFEAHLEGRWHLFQNAGNFWFINLENISVVGFYDLGDIWGDVKQIRLSEMAMAGGIGFRWDTIAGPIRIDFGMRVYDPFDSSNRKWFTQRRFFHDTYSLVHFGIGHTF